MDTDTVKDSDVTGKWEPGTVVLAKVKGYPAWPGMILDETLVPSGVLGAKPGYKKRKSNGGTSLSTPVHYPVRFFADNTHMWATKADLKLLDVDAAKAYVAKNASSKRDRTLFSAYEIAADPPSLTDFVAGNYGPVDEADPSADEGEDEGDREPQKGGKSKSARTSKPVKKSRAKDPKAAAASSSKQLAEDLAARQKRVLFLRHKLQKGFLSTPDEPSTDELPLLSALISELENMPDLELAIIRNTKINKVLKGILKIPVIPEESKYRFHARSVALLNAWAPLLNPGGKDDAGAEGKAGEAHAAEGTEGKAVEAHTVEGAEAEIQGGADGTAEGDADGTVEGDADGTVEGDADGTVEREAKTEAAETAQVEDTAQTAETEVEETPEETIEQKAQEQQTETQSTAL